MGDLNSFIKIAIIMTILITIIILILPSIAKKKAIKKVKKGNLSKIDFAKEKEYYRDTLSGYSPAELRYVDDFCINERREIIATLLNLELKHKIRIEEEGIIVIDSDEKELKTVEQLVLRSIDNGKVKIDKSIDIKEKIINEAIQDELIEKNTSKDFFIIASLISIILCILITIILYAYASSLDGNVLRMSEENAYKNLMAKMAVVGMAFILTSVTFSVIPTYIKTYIELKKSTYRRTEKGEKLNIKIEGLKTYMRDYSMLDQRNKEELTMWREYLIYSVIFDMNETIVEKISELIEF